VCTKESTDKCVKEMYKVVEVSSFSRTKQRTRKDYEVSNLEIVDDDGRVLLLFHLF
jgi:uncharacterized protein YeeX (DUF496 family)